LILFNIHIFVFLFSILFDIFLIEPVTKQTFDIDIIGFLITGLIFGFLITVIFNTVRFVVIITVRLLTVLFAVFLTVPVKVRFVFFDITGFFSTVLIGFLITGPIFGFLITVIFNTGRLLNVLFAEFLKVPVKEILFGIIGFLITGLIFGFLITVIFNTVRLLTVLFAVILITVLILLAVFLTVPVKEFLIKLIGFLSTVLFGFLITGPIFGFLITVRIVVIITVRLLNVLFAVFLKVPVKEILIGFLLTVLFFV